MRIPHEHIPVSTSLVLPSACSYLMLTSSLPNSGFLHLTHAQEVTPQSNFKADVHYGCPCLCFLSGAQRQSDTLKPMCNRQQAGSLVAQTRSAQNQSPPPCKGNGPCASALWELQQQERARSCKAQGNIPCQAPSYCPVYIVPFQAHSKLVNQHRVCRISMLSS